MLGTGRELCTWNLRASLCTGYSILTLFVIFQVFALWILLLCCPLILSLESYHLLTQQDPGFLHCGHAILSHSFLSDCPKVWPHHRGIQCRQEVLNGPTSIGLPHQDVYTVVEVCMTRDPIYQGRHLRMQLLAWAACGQVMSSSITWSHNKRNERGNCFLLKLYLTKENGLFRPWRSEESNDICAST